MGSPKPILPFYDISPSGRDLQLLDFNLRYHDNNYVVVPRPSSCFPTSLPRRLRSSRRQPAPGGLHIALQRRSNVVLRCSNIVLRYSHISTTCPAAPNVVFRSSTHSSSHSPPCLLPRPSQLWVILSNAHVDLCHSLVDPVPRVVVLRHFPTVIFSPETSTCDDYSKDLYDTMLPVIKLLIYPTTVSHPSVRTHFPTSMPHGPYVNQHFCAIQTSNCLYLLTITPNR